MDASYKNQDGVGLLLETPDGVSAAFYSSEKLHKLIYKAGELYPEYLQSQRDTDISAPDLQMIFADLSKDNLQNLPKNEYRSEIAEALHRILEKLSIENDITGTSSAVRIVFCIPLNI